MKKMIHEKKARIAIVPGSFDPITVGHIDILKRAAALYDKVYLALLINPDKKYLFDTETRIEIAKLLSLWVHLNLHIKLWLKFKMR